MSDTLSIVAVLRRVSSAYVGRAPVLLSAAFMLAAVIDLDSVRFGQATSVGVALINLLLLTLFVCFVVLVADDLWRCGARRSASELLRSTFSTVGRLLLVGVVAGLTIGLVGSIGSVLLIAMILNAALAGASLATIVAGVLLALIVLLVPQLHLMTRWSVCVPVVVLERPGRLRALRRSRELVRGNGLRVLALILMLTVPLSLGSTAFAGAFHLLGSAPALAGQLLLTTLIAPIPVLAVTALYYELREIEPVSPVTALPVPDPT